MEHMTLFEQCMFVTGFVCSMLIVSSIVVSITKWLWAKKRDRELLRWQVESQRDRITSLENRMKMVEQRNGRLTTIGISLCARR